MGNITERMQLRALTNFFCAAFLAATCLVDIRPASAAGQTSDVTKKTRFIVGLDRHADFHIISLSNPNRVVIELGNVKLQLPPQPKSGPIGLVEGFHGGRAGGGKSRIVINVTQPVVVEKSNIERVGKGYHLNLEIVPLTTPKRLRTLANAPFDKPSGLGAGGLQPPMPRKAFSRDAWTDVAQSPSSFLIRGTVDTTVARRRTAPSKNKSSWPSPTLCVKSWKQAAATKF